jgi:hypothetical protein
LGNSLTPVVLNNPTQLQGAGWPLWGQKISYSNVNDATTLATIAAQLIPALAVPLTTPTFTLEAGAVGFADFALGDQVYVVINDPYRFPDSLGGPFKGHYRVVGTSVSPPTETADETFGFTIYQPNPSG